jgi:site-specific DNA recombinase
MFQSERGLRRKAMKVAIYARVSSDRQEVDLSIGAQLRALREYAAKNGYQVVREYVDEAESGRTADRPQFQRMIAEAGRASRPFQKVLVWKFARSREDAIVFKSLLKKHGLRVESITESSDDSPTGKLMEAIIESLDEFYSANLGQEVLRGMRGSVSRGFYVASRTPYGYRRVKVKDGKKERATLQPDAATAPFVQRMFEDFL